ncbi:N-6 DNA methylase [Sphingomonas histidinilytica]|uniref:N-6 DNA methylase n=1 Tax=Rhizorhabdus histidinilytica TaxID=439228 RepID=UPI001ADA18C3|nr:N-6 DNA methylase [Rhizorhabdus histidinilytica]MBO9375552.1 N-6 DNA methylase [Rhizorhabdus histidinilytica]
MTSRDSHLKALCKLLRSCQPRHDLYTVFADCMEASAIAISNSVDAGQREARESRYLEIVARYDRDIIDLFPRVLGELTLALECEPGDILGAAFGELELHNTARGQFFTPYEVCRMMAMVTVGKREQLLDLIERHGFVRAAEPACGAGAMIIALAEAMREEGINYQRHLHVTAVDIDARAAHMAYIQLSLLHIPATVVVGNSLSLETREVWYTPAHIVGGWSRKLAARQAERTAVSLLSDAGPSDEGTEPARPQTAEPPRQLTLF